MILGFAMIIIGLALVIVGIFYLGYCIGKDLAYKDILHEWMFDYIVQDLAEPTENLTCENLTCENLTCEKFTCENLTCEYAELIGETEKEGNHD